MTENDDGEEGDADSQQSAEGRYGESQKQEDKRFHERDGQYARFPAFGCTH